MDNEFSKAMVRTAKCAISHSKSMRELNLLFETRYGIGYNDTDDEYLIDIFDYYGGEVPTMEFLDVRMAEMGHSRIDEEEK